jgi:hypothetical protein
VLTATLFDQLVNENIDNIKQRPSFERNTAVGLNKAGTTRLHRLVKEYSPVLAKIVPEHWPRLDVLNHAFWRSFHYVPFQILLDDLLTLVSRALKYLKRVPLRHVVMLALPRSHVDKSSLWFNCYAWAHNKKMRDTVDFIVPSMDSARTLMDRLPNWTATVLYIDDMAYSGSQMADFRDTDTNMDGSPIVFYPIVVYKGEKVDINNYNITEQSLLPTLTTPLYTMRYWLTGIQLEPGTYLHPHPLPSQEEIATIMMELIADEITDPERTFALTFYELFITAVNFPAVVFEHKLADYASIAVRLFMQTPYAPGEKGWPEDRQLVRIGKSNVAAREEGSWAFYKDLVWTFKAKKLNHARFLESVYFAHHGLAYHA